MSWWFEVFRYNWITDPNVGQTRLFSAVSIWAHVLLLAWWVDEDTYVGTL